ncbi:hypothetical protein ACMD2_27128 [Ananas comosus]|uniref:Uncharacterized protein n=1 Tax=Ananas comosus TaxID=4615 RepID=A0A199UYJ2_ANACO|nr:hypothetical protein ACMD2_27128 [Ananas comosus]
MSSVSSCGAHTPAGHVSFLHSPMPPHPSDSRKYHRDPIRPPERSDTAEGAEEKIAKVPSLVASFPFVVFSHFFDSSGKQRPEISVDALLVIFLCINFEGS